MEISTQIHTVAEADLAGKFLAELAQIRFATAEEKSRAGGYSPFPFTKPPSLTIRAEPQPGVLLFNAPSDKEVVAQRIEKDVVFAGETAELEVIPAPNEAPAAAAASVPTEQLMTLMREAAGRAGLPAVAKLMETYAATRVSDIPADRSAAFAADLSSLTAAAA